MGITPTKTNLKQHHVCAMCRSREFWSWEDAFNKFGYEDGDGTVMTHEVAGLLKQAGYTVQTDRRGFRNTIIHSIKRGNKELIPEDAEIGYADPRNLAALKAAREDPMND